MRRLLCAGHCDRLWGHRNSHLPSGSLKVQRESGIRQRQSSGTGERPGQQWDGRSAGFWEVALVLMLKDKSSSEREYGVGGGLAWGWCAHGVP